MYGDKLRKASVNNVYDSIFQIGHLPPKNARDNVAHAVMPSSSCRCQGRTRAALGGPFAGFVGVLKIVCQEESAAAGNDFVAVAGENADHTVIPRLYALVRSAAALRRVFHDQRPVPLCNVPDFVNFARRTVQMGERV